MDAAQAASIHKASQVPEFIHIHEYIAQQYTMQKKLPLVISTLSKALSVLPDNMTPPLLIWRSHAYLMAGVGLSYQEDLDKARRLKFRGTKKLKVLIDHLLSHEEKRWLVSCMWRLLSLLQGRLGHF